MTTVRTPDGSPADEYISRPVRRAVKARDPRKCVYCGSRKRLTLDHVIPSSKGGLSVAENLVVACSPCNTEKGVFPVDMFAMLLEREDRGTVASILGRVYARLTRTTTAELPTMARSPVYMTGVAVDPASRGLDPRKYHMTLSVDRIDEKALTETELATIEAALAGDEMPEEKPAAKPASKPAAKGKKRAKAAE